MRRTQRALLALAALLAVAGCLLSIDMYRGHLEVLTGGVSDRLFCGAGELFDCHAVAGHESSQFLGLPLPGWGLFFYLLVAGAALAAALYREPDRRSALALGAVLGTSAVAVDLYLAYLMVAEIGSLCLGCIATYALNLALTSISWILVRTLPGTFAIGHLLPSPLALLRGEDAAYYRALLKAALLTASGASLALAAAWTIIPLRQIYAYGEEVMDALLEEIRHEEPQFPPHLFEEQPTIGPLEAPVQILLVGDFQCSLCRSLASKLDELRERWPSAIRAGFVNLPLCTDCNPHLRLNMHPDACSIAAAGECAALQGRFWEFHRFVYRDLRSSQVTKEAVLGRAAPAIGLELPLFSACMAEEHGLQAVKSDVALCDELGITVVPSTIINGHIKPGSMFPWMLERIVGSLLEEPP